MSKKIYLDSAATTYVNSEVLHEMMPTFNAFFGNASSIHSFGREAINLVDIARDRVAKSINAEPREIHFTSGGTEANNWAIYGLAHANRDKGNHIITSQIEHKSVLDTCKKLELEGFKVTYLPVDETGLVKLNELMHEINNNTILVSIMTANNEVGTIQHLNAISRTVKEKGIIFHTDAVSAFGLMNLNVKDLDIDAMSISSHKIYGPKGAGALFVKDGVKIDSLIVGGNQEFGKRAGTLNVPAIVGFGKACEIAIRDLSTNTQRLKSLREYFVKNVMAQIENVHLNGHHYQRLPNFANLSFEFVDNESLAVMLDLEGIAVSIGSACNTGNVEPSYVLKAMKQPMELVKSSVRFSIAKNVTKEDLDIVVEKLVSIVKKLRSISPLNKSVVGGEK